ncbi:MAG: hypothetical protein H0W63_04445 [Gemmatimonadaceae bacterium]|nr:hypothetical protein [Gemmatimonadaceae bacterium]
MFLGKIGKVLPFVLLLAPAAAQAKPKWKTVFAGSDLTVAMDTAAVTANADGSYSVWTRWDYKRARVLENKKSYTRLVEKAELKCSPIVMKRVNTALYDRAGTVVMDPEELGASEVRLMSWDPPKKNSDGEKVWAAVCRNIAARKKK